MLKQQQFGTFTSGTATASFHSSFPSPPACCSLRSGYAVQCRGLASHLAFLQARVTFAVHSAVPGICCHGSVISQRRLPLLLPSVTSACLRGVSRKAGSDPGNTTNNDGGNEQQASNGSSSSGGNSDSSSGNGSSCGNGSSGGGPRQLLTSSSGGQPGDNGSSSWLLAWLFSPSAAPVLLALVAAELAVLLLSCGKAADAQQTAAAALAAVQGEQAADSSCSSGLSTRESISTIKRLLREVFSDHLGFKARLDSLEKAAADEAEAADDYELRMATGSSASSWARAAVRATGWFSAAGVLPWTAEAPGADTLGMLHALGAAGQADGRIALHSVLAAGKRRITAELAHTSEQDGGQPMLQLQKLLYRVQIKKSLQLLIAPLGGSLDAIGRAITPIQADYGCTTALRRGHGLSVLGRLGSGKAASFSRGRLSATAGFFVGGSGKTSLAKLQLNGHEGRSLSLIAAKCRLRTAAAAADAAENGSGSSSSSGQQGLRFLGLQAPGRSSSSSAGNDAATGTVLGVAGVLPIQDALTATAWAEQPTGGQPGWGVGLFSTPDTEGFEAALVLGKPSTQHAAFRGGVARPVFCELTAKVPIGDGLSICPGALLAVRNGKGTLAYLMQSSWRF